MNKKYIIIFSIIILAIAIAIFYFLSLQKKNETIKKEEKPEPVAYKPNIYIYPVRNTILNVTLKFPKGGHVIKSIPEYNTGWNINVSSFGVINNEYNYLFYESTQPDGWQKEKGWVVPKAQLPYFFQENMKAFGFNDKEIADFTEYWIPRLTDKKYYAIYPQVNEGINKLIQVNFSQTPDNVLRVFYFIKGINDNQIIEKYNINSTFKRTGFHVAEWGVVM